MPQNSRSTRGTRGRSLVEILTAIGLSAILMGMAVPSFNGLRGPYILRQTTQQIAAELQAARMRAIARNARYRFTYVASTKTYTLERETAANVWTAEYSNQLAKTATLGSIGTPPTFSTAGMLNQNYDITVNIQGYPTTRTVTINVLGKVTIS